MFDGNIVKLGVFNYSNEILFDAGTKEFEEIYKSFKGLHSSLKNETGAFKRGDARDGGNVKIVYNNNESYKIYIDYAKTSHIIGITFYDKYNFSFTKYYLIENDIEEHFLNIYKNLLGIE